MSKFSIKNLAYAIYEASKNKTGDELDIVIKNTVKLIEKKQLTSKIDKILETLEEIIDKENKTLKLKLISKHKLPDKLEKEIGDYIKKKYKVDKLIIQRKEKAKILGGIIIEVGDEILDATLSNKIHKLQTYLIAN